MLLKYKDRKTSQISQTVIRNPKIRDKESVSIDHQKIACKLSKPLKQSEIITQLTKTAKKSGIADIKSVTLEHPKTITKLSKPIKQAETITQEPKAIAKLQKKSL